MNLLKKAVVLAAFVPGIGVSGGYPAPYEQARNEEILRSMNLPLPNSGVQVLPLKQIAMPSNLRKQMVSDIKQQKIKGYVQSESARAVHLYSIKTAAVAQFAHFAKEDSAESTHMRHAIGDVNVGFTFKGVPVGDMQDFIGVAPEGVYRDVGWSGIVQFFQNSKLGVCSYTQDSFALSHGGAQVAQEFASNEVNGKVTVLHFEGSKASGFAYNAEWYDSFFYYELSCANPSYSRSIKSEFLDLARRIDTYA